MNEIKGERIIVINNNAFHSKTNIICNNRFNELY